MNFIIDDLISNFIFFYLFIKNLFQMKIFFYGLLKLQLRKNKYH